jgi:hypothetical protein
MAITPVGRAMNLARRASTPKSQEHPRSLFRGRRAKTYAGVLALAAVTSVVNSCEHRVITSASVGKGHGVVTKVFGLEKSCYGGTQADITSSAKIDHNVPLMPDIFWTSAKYSGNITTEICTNEDKKKATKTVQIDYNGPKPKITVTYPPEAFQATVYPTNPLNPKSTNPDSGAGWALYDGFSKLVEGLPGDLQLPGADETNNVVGGLALLGAYMTDVKACIPKAWPYVAPIMKKNMQEYEYNNHNTENDARPVELDNVTIKLPTIQQLEIPSQYEAWYTSHKGNLNSGDTATTLTYPNVNDLHCQVTKDVKVVN